MNYQAVYVLSQKDFINDTLHLDGANGPLGYIEATQNFVNELQYILSITPVNDFEAIKKELTELIQDRKEFIEFAKHNSP